MTDRVSSEHPSVQTVRAKVARSGSTNRPELAIHATDSEGFPADEVVRVVLSDTEYFAPIEQRNARVRIPRASDNRRLARISAGPNRLAEWIDAAGIEFGRSVLIDIVVPGFRYGIRAPGETAVYHTSEPPADSLRSIAERISD